MDVQSSVSFFRRLDRAIIVCLLIAVLLVILIAIQPWIDPRWLYLDTQTVGELSGDCCHIYDGAVSNLGLMLWASTAAVALFGALLCVATDRPRAAIFSLHGFVLSAVLAVDDAYLLHEIVAPKIGIPQVVFLGLIGLTAMSYFILQRRFLLRSGRWVLAISLMGFAISLGIDQVYHSIEPFWVVAEDGPKFVGIVAWFLFHLRAQLALILDQTEPDLA